MADEFEVVIVRTYETRIKVTGAKTAADARRQVEAYGLLEATGDFPKVGDGEQLTVERIKSVKKIETNR